MLLLQAISVAAERSGSVYPFKNEDWLRYQLPSLWPPDDRLLLIAGPSTVRENVLYEEVQARFPALRVFQGGLSLGTLADVTLSLEYVERMYGPGALPRVMILGLSPRFLAEIPDRRPMEIGLDRYSPRYRVGRARPDRLRLEAKRAVDGTADWLDFLLTKQQPRYRSALSWWTAEVVGPGASEALSDHVLEAEPVRTVLSRAGLGRVAAFGLEGFARLIASPYRYRGREAWPEEVVAAWMDEEESWWRAVHGWDPTANAASVRARVDDLFAVACRHEIELFVVSMPERTVSLERYGDGYIEAYDALVRELFSDLPLLDLRLFLEDEAFYDAEHVRLPGAERVTERVIRFVRTARTLRTRDLTERCP